MSTASMPPAIVQDLRDACMRFVERAVGVALDGTPDTLPLLDHYVALLPDRTSDEVVALIAPAVGVYFGEVLRRQFADGEWHCPTQEPASFRLRFSQCFLELDPVGIAVEVLFGGARANDSPLVRLHEQDRAAIEASLEHLGPIKDDDYQRLSVRFEVIDQIHDHATHRHRDRFPLGRTYVLEDYDGTPLPATLH